jgi:hypothetical protein
VAAAKEEAVRIRETAAKELAAREAALKKREEALNAGKETALKN